MKLSSHGKIAIGWGVAVVFGLYSFYLSKEYVTSHKYEAMKARERIARATENPDQVQRPSTKDY